MQNRDESISVKTTIKNTRKRADPVVNSISGAGEHNLYTKVSELSSDAHF